MSRSLLLLLISLVPGSVLAKDIVGWVEKALIFPGKMVVKTRIDTGAKTSSLGVDAFNYFKRDNHTWVHFAATNYAGEEIWLDRKLHRTVKIKRDNGTVKERPVIILGICVGKVYKETEVNLEERGNKNYQMLIGRTFLGGDFLVDPNAVFLNQPRCNFKSSQ